jgi:hypothetical protein
MNQSLSLQSDTLAYQLGVRPGVIPRNMESASLHAVVGQLNKFMDGKTTGTMVGVATEEAPEGKPEKDGIIFYLLNHAVSVIRKKHHVYEGLGGNLPILELYHKELAFRSARMFYYMLLICTRESRHAKNQHGDAYWTKLGDKYGQAIVKFHKGIKGTGSDSAASALRTHPPDTTVGNYTVFMAELFNTGSFSSGYGGKAWGKVAEVLRDFILGKLTAEMMMDTAFTLCHNNGPIFNKGMLFSGYTDEIYKILDVQRSGQIPQFLANSETKWRKDKEVDTFWNLCADTLGDCMKGNVDWFLVEELGAMKTYATEKSQQVAKYGQPSKFKAKIEVEKLKKNLAAAKIADEEQNMVQIMPDLKVKKVEVPR